MNNHIKIISIVTLLILFTGCQKQISISKGKRIGVFSKIQNTIMVENNTQVNKSISSWTINNEVENFVLQLLKEKGMYNNVEALKRTQSIILYEEGRGKGIPSLLDMVKKQQVDYLVYIYNYYTRKNYSEGINFYRIGSIFDNEISERVYLNIAIGILEVNDDKFNSVYFGLLDQKNDKNIFKSYYSEEDNKSFDNRNLDEVKGFIETTIKSKVYFHLKKSGILLN